MLLNDEIPLSIDGVYNIYIPLRNVDMREEEGGSMTVHQCLSFCISFIRHQHYLQ
jgi:hypothetical protein